MNKEQILQQIRRRRKTLGKSQREVSDSLQMTQPLYSSYETGKSDVGIEKLLRICETLDLELILVEKEGVPPLTEANKADLKARFAEWLENISEEK